MKNTALICLGRLSIDFCLQSAGMDAHSALSFAEVLDLCTMCQYTSVPLTPSYSRYLEVEKSNF